MKVTAAVKTAIAAAKKSHNNFVGFGVGLRAPHYTDVVEGDPQTDWFEIISENYLIDGGRPKFFLEKIRQDYPVACHGVSLNIGSSDPLNTIYLKKLKTLIEEVEPFLVSDHLCWTGVGGENLHDLFPLPYRQDVASYVSERISRVQEVLKRQILIENVSSYVTYKNSEMSEWDFINIILEKSGCGLLLDVNNVYVSSVNHRFDPLAYLNAIPASAVQQIHLAGYTEKVTPHGRFLIDTHSAPVSEDVWKLYEYTIGRLGPMNTLVEWDDNIPRFKELEAELIKAKAISKKVIDNGKSARGIAPYPTKNSQMGSFR